MQREHIGSNDNRIMNSTLKYALTGCALGALAPIYRDWRGECGDEQCRQGLAIREVLQQETLPSAMAICAAVGAIGGIAHSKMADIRLQIRKENSPPQE